MTTYIGKTTTIADSVGVIANVDAIGDLSLTADEIEDTVYGTGGWKTFVQGLKDAGTFDLTVNYGKDTSGNTRLTQAFVSGDSEQYTITFPDASTLIFTAFVSGVGIAVPKDEKVQRTFTLRIDGKTPPAFSEASST
ncbi:MAG: phage tail tube protein [Bacilli bacterium]|jgi:predicted secreted protein